MLTLYHQFIYGLKYNSKSYQNQFLLTFTVKHKSAITQIDFNNEEYLGIKTIRLFGNEVIKMAAITIG